MRGLLLIPTLLAFAACTSPKTAHLDVYAATSLTEVFESLAQAYTAAHPEREIRLHFAGSQTLRLQIEQGAPADVFASANPDHIEALRRANRIQSGVVFAQNALAVIVDPIAAPQVDAFPDLPKVKRLVIGTAETPVGRYARQLIEQAAGELGPHFAGQVMNRVVSHESNTRLVRAKVALGEADAAIVYATDTKGLDGIRTLAIPPAINVSAAYEMGVVTGGDAPEEARRWLAFVTSPAGQAHLEKHGFLLP